MTDCSQLQYKKSKEYIVLIERKIKKDQNNVKEKLNLIRTCKKSALQGRGVQEWF